MSIDSEIPIQESVAQKRLKLAVNIYYKGCWGRFSLIPLPPSKSSLYSNHKIGIPHKWSVNIPSESIKSMCVLSRRILAERYALRILVFLLLHEMWHIVFCKGDFIQLCKKRAWVTNGFPYVTWDVFIHCFLYTLFNCNVTGSVIKGNIYR